MFVPSIEAVRRLRTESMDLVDNLPSTAELVENLKEGLSLMSEAKEVLINYDPIPLFLDDDRYELVLNPEGAWNINTLECDGFRFDEPTERPVSPANTWGDREWRLLLHNFGAIETHLKGLRIQAGLMT